MIVCPEGVPGKSNKAHSGSGCGDTGRDAFGGRTACVTTTGLAMAVGKPDAVHVDADV